MCVGLLGIGLVEYERDLGKVERVGWLGVSLYGGRLGSGLVVYVNLDLSVYILVDRCLDLSPW